MSQTGAFVVTGAGSGIGKAIAARLLKNGHYVCGLGRDARKLTRAAGEFNAGKRFVHLAVDLSKGEATQRAANELREWLKKNNLPLLGLVNNAGVFDRVAFDNSDDALWDKHFQINLLAAVRLTRELGDALKTSAPSSVLNISSTLGLRPIAMTSAYSALKAAMINWTQSLAIEWAAHKVRVNCLAPGIVDTPIHPFHNLAEDSVERQSAHAAQPIGQLGTPEDIAAAACFLLSDDSRWTTGAVLSVDGGIHL